MSQGIGDPVEFPPEVVDELLASMTEEQYQALVDKSVDEVIHGSSQGQTPIGIVAHSNAPKRIACRILTLNTYGEKHPENTVIRDRAGRTFYFDKHGSMRHCHIRETPDGVVIIPLVKKRRHK